MIWFSSRIFWINSYFSFEEYGVLAKKTFFPEGLSWSTPEKCYHWKKLKRERRYLKNSKNDVLCIIYKSELSEKKSGIELALGDVQANHNLGQKVEDKFRKLSKIGFSMKCFTAGFLQFFYQKTSKFGFRLGGWVLAIKSKHCRNFLEIS